MDRAFERDIIPMAREHGMALAPWNVLAGGKLRSDVEEERREKSGENGRDLKINEHGWKRTEQERKMSNALEKVGKEVGVDSVTAGKYTLTSFHIVLADYSTLSVAIAYVMHKAPYVFPLVGGRKVEHLMQNIEALNIALSPAQIEYLESIMTFDAGFPHNIAVCCFLNRYHSTNTLYRAMGLNRMACLLWQPRLIGSRIVLQ